jgi:gamma-glutamyltranspeptidase/glutathione hydrolase
MKSSGSRFAVSSGCRYATFVALDILKDGGNVFDAALAGAAVLCVTSPHAVSIGGDLFALVKRQGSAEVTALNSTGSAPRRADIEFYRGKGFDSIPIRGSLSIQIPGFIAGWELMAQRWASRSAAHLLEPAITLARDGFKASARFARLAIELANACGKHRGWTDTYRPSGKSIQPGDLFRQDRLANTLMLIARDGAKAFYDGPIASDIARSVTAAGGIIDVADLNNVTPQVTPSLSTQVAGHAVHTQPPVSQGAVLLRALSLFEQSSMGYGREIDQFWPNAAKAMQTAFAERLQFFGDVPNSFTIAEDMIAGRLSQPLEFVVGNTGTETTTIAVADAAGNAASLILSIFADFGSAVVTDETGILLNNRLTGFVLDENHPNALKPGKRAMHTLHSVIVLDGNGEFALAGGSPGGHAQPQTNLQVLSRVLMRQADLEDAVRAPRWMLTNASGAYGQSDALMRDIQCEPGISDALKERFKTAGFSTFEMSRPDVGSAKWVQRSKHQLIAACDERRDAAAAAA